MPGLPEIYAELQKVFLDRFAKPRDGRPGDAFVAFAFGTPIPDASFRLNDPARTLSPELAIEFLAGHADVVPDVRDACFIRSVRTVTNQFLLLLNGATATTDAGSELLGLVKAESKPLFEPVLGLKNEYRRLDATPANWFDLSNDNNWTTINIDHHNNPPPPPPPTHGGSNDTFTKDKFLLWRKAPAFFETELAKPVNTELFATDPVKILNRRLIERQSQIVEETPFHSVLLAAEPILEAPALRLVQSNERRLSGNLEIRNLRRFERETLFERNEPPVIATENQPAPFKEKFISAQQVGQLVSNLHEEATAQQVTADGFKLSLRFCLVELKRPWLSDALLSLPDWYVPGFAKGDFSKGQADNMGIMAYVPTACIIVRDVSISANWAEEDKAIIQNATEMAGFSLLGRDYDQNSQTLNIPGLQSFAWICQPMPVLPPANSPN
jgi:hypothetical protein